MSIELISHEMRKKTPYLYGHLPGEGDDKKHGV